MFWGLVMDPNKWYTQTVEIPFHVSMATLDIANANEELVQVILCYNNTNYQLCSLKKDSVWQVPLNLNFQKGIKIAFSCNGPNHVHLTGYLKLDEDFELEEEDDDDDDVDDDNTNSEEELDEDKKDDEEDDNDDDEVEKIQERSSKQVKKNKLMQQQRQKQEKNQNKQKKNQDKQKLVIEKPKKNNKERNKKRKI